MLDSCFEALVTFYISPIKKVKKLQYLEGFSKYSIRDTENILVSGDHAGKSIYQFFKHELATILHFAKKKTN